MAVQHFSIYKIPHFPLRGKVVLSILLVYCLCNLNAYCALQSRVEAGKNTGRKSRSTLPLMDCKFLPSPTSCAPSPPPPVPIQRMQAYCITCIRALFKSCKVGAYIRTAADRSVVVSCKYQDYASHHPASSGAVVIQLLIIKNYWD